MGIRWESEGKRKRILGKTTEIVGHLGAIRRHSIVEDYQNI